MTHSHTARWVIACLAGCAFALGLSPYDLWPCIPLSAGVLFTLLRDDPFATPWRTGLAYGLGFFGVSVSWVYVSIHVYGPTPVWLAALLTALFCGGLALLHGFQASLFYRLGSRHLSWRLWAHHAKQVEQTPSGVSHVRTVPALARAEVRQDAVATVAHGRVAW